MIEKIQMHPLYSMGCNPRDLWVSPSIVARIDPNFEMERYRFSEGLLARYGRPFNATTKPTITPRLGNGWCYENALQLAASCPSLVYVEGFIIFQGGYVMGHGWCSDQGLVVDPTAVIKHPNELVYYGVQIRLEYVQKWKGKYGYAGLLDGHPEYGKIGVYEDPVDVWLVR